MAVLSPSLQVTSEFADDDARRAAARERFADFGARAFICALFVFFATQIGGEFARTGHVTGLLLLVSELLVVLLTVVRRPAIVVDRAMSTRLVAAVSMVGIYFIRPVGTPLVSDLATATVSGAGLLAIIAAKLTLGRSFGLMPANRGIVSRGIYRVVAHPIYAAIWSRTPRSCRPSDVWNGTLLVTSDAALLVRAVRRAHAGARSGTRTTWSRCAGACCPGLLLIGSTGPTLTVMTFQRFATVLLFLAIATAACLMPAQSDTFWQLRAGQEMAASGNVMLHDAFTYSVRGGFWPNHEWLSEVLFYGLWRVGGMPRWRPSPPRWHSSPGSSSGV